ncbi:MAG: hypothetical protein P0Y56_09570 [Candidatus Andeanibacterium colombiense]|uniref:Uncharacterized protein n=1 Tax=Candidatus Andeanibacterium colombiense TaxID=3121345 RepID=A0AAJ5X3I2_9SPHN|nr:MAG: hypothetical protein P0Y56_09570 [Sphingomonadaceae bacterium]
MALSWPGYETQGWMALAAGTLALAHWAYHSVWLRLPEWRLFAQEARGHRVSYAEREAIGLNRSWADEEKLANNGPLKSLSLGLAGAFFVWLYREVPAGSEHWVSEAFNLCVALLVLLWPILRGQPEEVGAPPKAAKEPEGVLEGLLGEKGAQVAHIAFAALVLSAAYLAAN